MSKTVLTKKQQKEWVQDNPNVFQHRWSSRGLGISKLLSGYSDTVISKASGCGYDRFGAALGKLIEHYFQDELKRIALRHCKGRSQTRKESSKYYGLFYNKKTGRAYLDGACGTSSMERILNKIGFTCRYLGRDNKSNNNGVEFFEIAPISPHQYKYL